ncbi:MAG: family 43 glycosylhydrolase [Bacteroidales bacterium]|nr:family 43 glycosylhydrolase [Bacteroidales bacterium]
MKKIKCFLFLVALSLFTSQAFSQNPIIRDQFTADPSARVFNGRVYVYPSHDILAKEGMGRPGWFCMADYHVFSSENLTEWTDHGVIVSQNKVNWVDSTSYSMWAPDCIERNGKYYFYFPANDITRDFKGRKPFSIGVAIAEQPEGPYIPQPEAIEGIMGIDPNVFIDKDGQAYLYYSMGKIFVARLKDNMLELASEPQEVKDLPEKGLKEGPWLFERHGIYYMTYPHVENKIERLEYGMGDNPMGPFKFAGVIMDESPVNCWTNHHSTIAYDGQWYLFYHQNALSPKFDKNRSVCIDSLFFNEDGTIQKVVPTLRGVGISKASQQIEIDRYSALSETGAEVAFIDTLNTFLGWKTILSSRNTWVRYDAVDFGSRKPKTVQVKVIAEKGGILQIRLNSANGPLLSQVKVPVSSAWNRVEAKVKKFNPGIHNLVIVSSDENPVEIDWISFK